MTVGWLFLGAMIAIYGVANFLQSMAASRVSVHHTLDPILLFKLAGQRTYLVGVACQVIGYLLAVFARRDLPLFLVQASVAAGLGVTALLGVLVLRWRLPRAEVILLGLLIVGVTALVLSAHPGPPRQVTNAILVGLVVALVLVAVAGFFAVRLRGSPGAVALGALAGVAFGAASVASRPLVNAHDLGTVVTDPLLYLLLGHSLVGQLLFGLALQRGSTTAAVAAMDAAFSAPPAAVGLLLLGDKIESGREWLAAVGFLITLGSVLGLTRYAEPQYHHHVAHEHEHESVSS
jgi:drug/metabolite transporter (DMT)-like permease